MEEQVNLPVAFMQLQQQYLEGIEAQDAKLLTAFVKDDRVLLFKGEGTFAYYVQLRTYRAECFILLGLFSEGIKECRLALMMANSEAKADLYVLWAKLLFLQFIKTDEQDDLLRIAKAAIEVAKKGQSVLLNVKNAEYTRMALVNNEAFFLVYCGERKRALALYQNFKFTPIPIPIYNDNTDLISLFSNFNKGLAVAIELQDANLLRHLLQVISIDDQVLHSAKSLFKIFHSTLITTMDTHSQFADEFNLMFDVQPKVSAEMKELNFFLTSISSNMMKALEMAFNLFK